MFQRIFGFMMIAILAGCATEKAAEKPVTVAPPPVVAAAPEAPTVAGPVADSVRYCKVDTDCPSGSLCIGGQCVNPTSGDQADLDRALSDCGFTRSNAAGIEQLTSIIYFDFNNEQLNPAAVEQIKKNLRCLKMINTQGWTLTGHADQRGPVDYNLSLSDKRARQVQDYLSRNIDVSKFSVIPKGKFELACEQETEECYAKNRRVVITLGKLKQD